MASAMVAMRLESKTFETRDSEEYYCLSKLQDCDAQNCATNTPETQYRDTGFEPWQHSHVLTTYDLNQACHPFGIGNVLPVLVGFDGSGLRFDHL